MVFTILKKEMQVAKIQDSADKERRLGAVFLGTILVLLGLFFISSGRVYSTNFLFSMVAGPFTIIAGFLLSYVAIFKWEILHFGVKGKKFIYKP